MEEDLRLRALSEDSRHRIRLCQSERVTIRYYGLATELAQREMTLRCISAALVQRCHWCSQ
jgi:hypothetical protein